MSAELKKSYERLADRFEKKYKKRPEHDYEKFSSGLVKIIHSLEKKLIGREMDKVMERFRLTELITLLSGKVSDPEGTTAMERDREELKISLALFLYSSFVFGNKSNLSLNYPDFHFIEPSQIKNIVYWECRKYKSKQVIWQNIAPIISVESSFATNAVSKDKCRGLMGVSPVLIREYNRRGLKKRIKYYQTNITEETVFRVRYNLKIGIWYWDQCLKRSRGNMERAYTLYFWGINSKRKTSFYSRKILKRKIFLLNKGVISENKGGQ